MSVLPATACSLLVGHQPLVMETGRNPALGFGIRAVDDTQSVDGPGLAQRGSPAAAKVAQPPVPSSLMNTMNTIPATMAVSDNGRHHGQVHRLELLGRLIEPHDLDELQVVSERDHRRDDHQHGQRDEFRLKTGAQHFELAEEAAEGRQARNREDQHRERNRQHRLGARKAAEFVDTFYHAAAAAHGEHGGEHAERRDGVDGREGQQCGGAEFLPCRNRDQCVADVGDRASRPSRRLMFVCSSAPSEPIIIDRPAMIEMMICHWSMTEPNTVNRMFAKTTVEAIFGAEAKNATTGVGAPS